MKSFIKTLSLALIVLMLVCMSACSSKKAEITAVLISDTSALNIQYTAKSDLKAGDLSFKITVSQDKGNVTGTVYSISEQKQDLEKGQKYIGLFDLTAERSWTVDGSLKMGGATVRSTLNTADILAVMGQDAKVTVTLLVSGEPVSEMELDRSK